MPDYYYQTLGQAWAAVVAAFTGANAITYSTAGFSITWVTGSGANGGKIVVAGTPLAGPDYASGNYWAREAKTGAGLPLNQILREAGFQDVAYVTSTGTAGWVSALALFGQLASVRRTAIPDVTGATAVPGVDLSLAAVGGPATYLHSELRGYEESYDVGLDLFSVVDLAGQLSTAPITDPAQPTWASSAAPQVTNRITLASRLDLDMAINNGADIYSATSNTFSGT